MCVGMTKSLRCSPETVTVLSVNQLYPSMEFKKNRINGLNNDPKRSKKEMRLPCKMEL